MASPSLHQPIPTDDPSKSMAWKKTISQEAFIHAQQEALEAQREAFHALQIAKALKLSKETAASEEEKRRSALPPSSAAPSGNQSQRKRSESVSTATAPPLAPNPGTSATMALAKSNPAPSSSSTTTPIPIATSSSTIPQTRGRKVSSHPVPAPSSTALPPIGEVSSSKPLARSWQPDDPVVRKPSALSSQPKSTPSKTSESLPPSTSAKSITANTNKPPPTSSTSRQTRSNTVSNPSYHYSSSSISSSRSKNTTSTPPVATTNPSLQNDPPRSLPKQDASVVPVDRDTGRKAPSSSSSVASSQPVSPDITPRSSSPRRQHERRPSVTVAEQLSTSKTSSSSNGASSRTRAPSKPPPQSQPQQQQATQAAPSATAATTTATPTATTAVATEPRKIPSSQELQQGMIINPMSTPTHTNAHMHTRNASVASTSVTEDVVVPQTTTPTTDPTTENTNIFTRSSPCPTCGTLLASPRGRFSVLSTSSRSSQQFAELLHLHCARCETYRCRGCLKGVPCSPLTSGCSVGLGSSSSASSGPTHSSSSASSGNRKCALRSCCPTVGVISVFEALSSFDDAYISEVAAATSLSSSGGNHHYHQQWNASFGFGPTKAQRQTYLKQLITRPDKDTRRLEDALIRTLKIVCTWLPASLSSTSTSSTTSPHPDTLTDLFSTSLLLEVVCAFLGHTVSAKDWIMHCDAYIGILEMLKKMYEGEMYGLLEYSYGDCIPFGVHGGWRGLGEWVWGVGGQAVAGGQQPKETRISEHSVIPPNGLFAYDDSDDEDDGFEARAHYYHANNRRARSYSVSRHLSAADRDPYLYHHHQAYYSSSSASTSTSSSSTSSPRTPYMHLTDDAYASSYSTTPSPSLSDLIRQLETHRRPLLALVGKVQFSTTLEKVNMLADAISYLLLQQVVAIN